MVSPLLQSASSQTEMPMNSVPKRIRNKPVFSFRKAPATNSVPVAAKNTPATAAKVWLSVNASSMIPIVAVKTVGSSVPN